MGGSNTKIANVKDGSNFVPYESYSLTGHTVCMTCRVYTRYVNAKNSCLKSIKKSQAEIKIAEIRADAEKTIAKLTQTGFSIFSRHKKNKIKKTFERNSN